MRKNSKYSRNWKIQNIFMKIQQGQDTIRNIRHDMKNRLSGILAAMQEEETDTQCIEAELKAALGMISSVKEERYCNNNYINSILSYKLQNIASDQIDVSVRMLYPEKLNIDYGDMGCYWEISLIMP